MEIFVPDYEWNSHWQSVEENVAECEYSEGDEFKMVRLTVGACTTYRIMEGKPVPVAVAFPDGVPSNTPDGRFSRISTPVRHQGLFKPRPSGRG